MYYRAATKLVLILSSLFFLKSDSKPLPEIKQRNIIKTSNKIVDDRETIRYTIKSHAPLQPWSKNNGEPAPEEIEEPGHHKCLIIQERVKNIKATVHRIIIKRFSDQQSDDDEESAFEEKEEVKQSVGLKLLKQANVKDRLHRVVKRHAAPDPRPKGGGSPSGNVQEAEHEGLVIRNRLTVGQPVLVLTIIVLFGLFCIMTFSIGYYWRTLICA